MIRSYIIFVLMIFIIIFPEEPEFAQTSVEKLEQTSLISDSANNGMRWRLIGPFRAGRALAAAGIPGDPATFYFGSVDGGVWKTTNAGVTWKPISDGQINPSIGALAISSSNPKIIYVGTGEADMRSDITYGGGVFKSIDGGVKWKYVGLKDTRHIGKILIDPKNPDVVLVAAFGRAYAPNKERGVFKTTDGGKSWEKVLYVNDKTGAIDLSWDVNDSKIIFASLWQAYRTPWSQYPPVEGNNSGIYKSTDEGKTWAKIGTQGLPDGPFGRIGVSVVQGSHGKKVYALIEALRRGSGLYYSNDGGNHWRFINNNHNIITRMWYFGRIFIDPKNPKIIYIPDRSLFRSVNGGKTFTAIKGSPGGDDYHYLWIDPKNDRHLIVAGDQGTSISLDNGLTWSSWYNQPTAQFYHVTTDNQFPYRVYGSQQDAGTVSITSRSDYGLITFRDWYSINGGESGYIAPDPKNPNIVFGGSTYGGLFRFNRITGQTQVVSPWLLSPRGQSIPQRKYRFTWTSPLAFDPHNQNSLYYGAQMLLKTTDGGLHWKAVSPDLTRANLHSKNNVGLSAHSAAHIGWGVIYSMAFSPIRNKIIWVGTDNGLIQLTKDGGKNWRNVTPPELTPWSKISTIDASPFDAKAAYAAVDRHRLNDFTPYIYWTKDYGKHWIRIDNGIPRNTFVRVVRADPYKKGLLFAGTETGVYVSFDNGEHWQSLKLNLPTVSIRDLDIHDNDLIAATHGRAFWILDDITSLRQMNKKAFTGNAFLFKPETAIRIRRSENHDTPLPPEFPHGENPPSGAIIDYYLLTKPESPVVLKIFDQNGNLIRKFSSEKKPQPIASQPYFMTQWLPEFHPLTVHRGLNRFVWDLRYPPLPTKYHYYSMAAIAGKGTVREPQGPFVLPGNYIVKLIVDNKSYSQTFKVVMDPRVKISKEELSFQLNLALKIWNAAANQLSLQKGIDTFNNQLISLQKNRNTGTNIKSKLKILGDKTKRLYNTVNALGIANLESTVLSADRQPTEQMIAAFNIKNQELLKAENSWKQLNGTDIKELNELINEKGFPLLKIPIETIKKIKFPNLK